jgi:hypothetical protein
MNIIRGSARGLARALRKAGPFRSLRSGKKCFLSPIYRWDDPSAPTFDWTRDIFLAYPDANKVSNAPSVYEKLKNFYRANKYQQWQELKEFFMCPEFKDPPFVRRPLRHEGGVGFVIESSRPSVDHDANYYWRSLWERSCEYRVFFVRGQKVLTLLKRVPDNTRQDIAWNHGVSSFVTVHDSENDRLRHSKFYEKAAAFFKAYPFHLCAVDVLYRKQRHRVVEVNFSPGILIPENLNALTGALLNVQAT